MMLRTLTSPLVYEIEKHITAPGWLIEIEASPSYLRYSTRGTIDWGGYTWSGGATLSGISELGIKGQVQITLPNIDNAATAIALSNTLRDVNVNIYALYDVDNTSILSGNDWSTVRLSYDGTTLIGSLYEGRVSPDTSTPVAVVSTDDTSWTSFDRIHVMGGYVFDYDNFSITSTSPVFSASDDFSDGTLSPWTQYGSGTIAIYNDATYGYVLRKTEYGDPNGGYWSLGTALSNFTLDYYHRLVGALTGNNAARVSVLDASGNGYGAILQTGNGYIALEKRTAYVGTIISTTQYISTPKGTQLATMKIDGVEAIDKMRATLSLRMTADVATHLPDVVIGPPLCNYIPQDGSSITWGTSKIIFER